MYIIIRSRTRHLLSNYTIGDDGKDGLNHTQGGGDGTIVNIYGMGELLSSVWDYGGYYIVYWRNGELVEQKCLLGLSCFVFCSLVCAWWG